MSTQGVSLLKLISNNRATREEWFNGPRMANRIVINGRKPLIDSPAMSDKRSRRVRESSAYRGSVAAGLSRPPSGKDPRTSCPVFCLQGPHSNP